MTSKPKYQNLEREVFDALASHYDSWTAKYPDDEIYAYVIYTPALVSSLSVSVLTEQGLAKVASIYKKKHGYKESLEQLAIDLRWSIADSPYCAQSQYQKLFDAVDERFGGMMDYVDSLEEDDHAFEKHINKLYSVLVKALKLLRSKKLGKGTKPLLYVDFGDMSEEERLSFIEQCNNKQAVKWYKETRELAG